VKWQFTTTWCLRLLYAGLTAWGWVKPKSTNYDLMLFGCTTVYMLLMTYLFGILFEVGKQDGLKFLNNKKKKDETKSN